MKTSNRTSRTFSKVICVLLMLILAYVSLFSCASGKNVTPVPAEIVKDIQREIVEVHDSIVERDSVYEYIESRGDTVLQKKIVYRDRYVLHPVKHSVYVEKCDTLRVPYPVERKLQKWEQFKLDYGGYALCSGFAFVCIIVGFMVRRIRKR